MNSINYFRRVTCLCVLGILGFSTPAFGFNPKGEYEVPEVHYRINNAGFHDPEAQSIEDQNNAIRTGASTWSSSGFRFIYDGPSGKTYSDMEGSDAEDNENVVIVRNARKNGYPGVLATTYTVNDTTQVGFDMVFWDGNPVNGVYSGATNLVGSAVAVAPFLGGSTSDAVLVGIDQYSSGLDYWRVRIGQGEPSSGVWSDVIAVPSQAGSLLSAGVAVGDFDGDSNPNDMIITGIDSYDSGNDYWRFVFGTDCTPKGCTFGDVITLSATAGPEEYMLNLSGGGIATAQLDSDPRPDLVIAAISYSPPVGDWVYRIGLNCGAGIPSGCVTWKPIKRIHSGAGSLSGGGVAFAQIDGVGLPEIVLAGIDNWEDGLDHWRYVVVRNLDQGGSGTPSPVQILDSGAGRLGGSGVTPYDMDGDGRDELVFSATDIWDDGYDYWRYRILSGCNAVSGKCAASPVQGVYGGGDFMMGGGVALNDADGNGKPDLFLVAIDNWEDGLDYWRTSFQPNCRLDGFCEHLTKWSVLPDLAGTNDIQGTAQHEFGHAAGLDHTDVPGSSMICNERPRGLGCDDVEGLQSLYSAGASDLSRLYTVPSNGAMVLDGVVGATSLTASGRPALVVAGIDSISSNNDYWRLAFGTVDASGSVSWSEPQTLYSGGDTLGNTAIALGDLNHNGIYDMIIGGMDIHYHDSPYWRYRVLEDCGNSIDSCVYGSNVSSVDLENTGNMKGNGIAIGSLGGNPNQQDVVFVGHANGTWRYRTCLDASVSTTGELVCANWSGVATVVSGATQLDGGGVGIIDLDLDGNGELIFASVDDGQSDHWHYAIGSQCSTGVCSAHTVRELPATTNLPSVLCNATVKNNYFNNDPVDLHSPGLTVANTSAGPQIWLGAVEPVSVGIRKTDVWRHAVLRDCHIVGGDWNCTLTKRGTLTSVPAAGVTATGGTFVSGTGIAAVDINASGDPDLVLAGVDEWSGGLDYWRVRIGMENGRCGP